LIRTSAECETIATNYVLNNLNCHLMSTHEISRNIEELKKDLRTLTLFSLGLKPMCIVDNITYECLESIGEPIATGDILVKDVRADKYVFQNEEVFNRFQKEVASIPIHFWGPLGNLLNYPPMSVSVFHDVLACKEGAPTDADRLYVDYHGQIFTSFPSVLAETCEWLEQNFIVPEEHKTRFTIKDFASGLTYTIGDKDNKGDVENKDQVIRILTNYRG